jgi:hypothetical protein
VERAEGFEVRIESGAGLGATRRSPGARSRIAPMVTVMDGSFLGIVRLEPPGDAPLSLLRDFTQGT